MYSILSRGFHWRLSKFFDQSIQLLTISVEKPKCVILGDLASSNILVTTIRMLARWPSRLRVPNELKQTDKHATYRSRKYKSRTLRDLHDFCSRNGKLHHNLERSMWLVRCLFDGLYMVQEAWFSLPFVSAFKKFLRWSFQYHCPSLH